MSLEKMRAEYNALPQWARHMVDALIHCNSHGMGSGNDLLAHYPENERRQMTVVNIALEGSEALDKWLDAFYDAKELADAMTVPYPPPTPPPHSEATTTNIVEMISDEGENAFDQPCHYGHRVADHAVYCHFKQWPRSPRKCRRTWYTDGKIRDDDCAGFYPNKSFTNKP